MDMPSVLSFPIPKARRTGFAESDEGLLLKARTGDAEAFGKLIERHQKSVLGFLLTFFHDLDLAEESTQEAFVKAFRALPSFEGRASFKTWISRIALNTARSQLRWNRLRRCLPLARSADEDNDNGGRLEELVCGRDEMFYLERKLQLEESMVRLSSREREIVALRLEGYTLQEVAEILRISDGTVKSTLFTAVHKMRKKLP